MRRTSRPAAVAVLAACLAVAPAAAASAASAPPQPPIIGGLAIDPRTGVATASITVRTSAPCPQGTNLLGKIYGHGFPAAGQNVVPNTPTSIYTTTGTGGYQVPLQDTIDDFLKLQPGGQKLQGAYTLTIECRNAFGAPFSRFVGTLTFASPTSFTAQPPKTYPAPPAPTATASGGAGAAGQAPGASAAGPQASGFPAAPNAAPGAPTTAVDDSFSVGSVGGVPLPLVVVLLVLAIGGVSWWNHRRGPSTPMRPADAAQATDASQAPDAPDAPDGANSPDAPDAPEAGEDAWPSQPLKR